MNDLKEVIDIILRDSIIPTENEWQEGYLSGIVDTYLYLTEKQLDFYPWNKGEING